MKTIEPFELIKGSNYIVAQKLKKYLKNYLR